MSQENSRKSKTSKSKRVVNPKLVSYRLLKGVLIPRRNHESISERSIVRRPSSPYEPPTTPRTVNVDDITQGSASSAETAKTPPTTPLAMRREKYRSSLQVLKDHVIQIREAKKQQRLQSMSHLKPTVTKTRAFRERSSQTDSESTDDSSNVNARQKSVASGTDDQYAECCRHCGSSKDRRYDRGPMRSSYKDNGTSPFQGVVLPSNKQDVVATNVDPNNNAITISGDAGNIVIEMNIVIRGRNPAKSGKDFERKPSLLQI